MALQPISSLHFQFFQPQTKTHHIFKFSLSCSNSNQKTAQVDIKVVKKKKHRPSFSDQIRHKWSLKLGSQRQKFPWQEQQQQQEEPELVEQPQSQEEQPQPLNFEFPKRLSPWHVAESPKQQSQFHSESDVSEDEENEKPLQQNSSGSVMEKEVQEAESTSLKKRRSNTELAEKFIPEHELRRLRNMALRMVERFSVGVAGITQELVDAIHEKWMVDEVVKFKFDSPLSANMKRAHQILESKTGGIVVWRSGSSIVLYRGMSYKLPCIESYTKVYNAKENAVDNSVDVGSGSSVEVSVKEMVGPIDFNRDSAEYLKDMSEEESMELIELNLLLDELGPRFNDWTGREPLPVDADQLPAVVPGYKTPFRLLPYGVKPCLSNKEMTDMRRVSRRTAPHFALGRNRELQGLARAIVKLWETSAIAKIAIKRGVPYTSNDRMAEELKAKTRFRKSEKDLAKIQGDFDPADLPIDLETLTNEERSLFRKMGLSMKPYLLLGRRDVYAGTIENMHLHWKYRELVKILVKGKNLAQVKHIAISLEAESGGVLVSVDKDTKGHIIIIYRGKNYFRPQVMRPKSLLSRRQALARSIELQRREALKHHISDLQEMIELLKSELEDMKNQKVTDGDKTM